MQLTSVAGDAGRIVLKPFLPRSNLNSPRKKDFIHLRQILLLVVTKAHTQKMFFQSCLFRLRQILLLGVRAYCCAFHWFLFILGQNRPSTRDRAR